jgi:hypothetical protein
MIAAHPIGKETPSFSFRRRAAWPPYQLVDPASVEAAEAKSRRLERLYHLTQEHAWDGKKVLGALVDRHGQPGTGMAPDVRASLLEILTLLLWGELAAWNISADLALEIQDTDAKMAATAQVFDEARHFYVLRDYVMMLAKTHAEGGAPPPLGGIPRKLLLEVIHAPSLAKKLVGMQLLFETNAVVIFRRIGEREICPILSELLPYFERDESRHVGLGVMYLPRLISTMSRAEAAGVAGFHLRALFMMIGGGLVLRPHFEKLGMDQRLMTNRVTGMQDDIVHQMAEAHGKAVSRKFLNPRRSKIGPAILDFLHPEGGLDRAPIWHRSLHSGLQRMAGVVDRALA